MDSQPINPNQGLNPLRETGGVSPGKSGATSGNGPAFEALLEKLQTQADGLRQKTEQVDDPGQLAGAVDMARTSLNDALSLSEQLLEAYRADLQKGAEGESSDEE